MNNEGKTKILKVDDSSNSLLKNTVDAINGYLLHNKGNAADFHLIKNIVDRQIESADEEINQMLPVPLYLGLSATMVGIICGLMSLRGDVSSEEFVNSIGPLLSSIKYAMICSLIGLLMTTVLSAVIYRLAKAKMEKQVNDLLNFIQRELLPHLNEDAVATLLNMQANLKQFNTNFEENIKGFSGILKDVHESFDAQVQLVKQLKQMDMVQMAQLNQNVLAKLHVSMKEFDKFTQYLNQMNNFVASTTRLTDAVNDQLDRTDIIKEIATGVRTNIERNQRVMDSLEEFMEKVDSSKAILTASKTLDSAVSDCMDTMKQHVQKEVENLKNYTSKATEDLDNLMQRERGQLDKLKNLDQLNTLVKSVQNMANENKTLTEGLAKRIASLTNAIENIGHDGGTSNGNSLQLWIITIIVTIVSVLFAINLFYPFNTGSDQSSDADVIDSVEQYAIPAPVDTVAHVNVNK